jgi:uncharacterized protein (DUF3820 family)
MTDNSLMPFGIHKGKELANVPAKYLLFLYNSDKCFDELREYIHDNLKILQQEKNLKLFN